MMEGDGERDDLMGRGEVRRPEHASWRVRLGYAAGGSALVILAAVTLAEITMPASQAAADGKTEFDTFQPEEHVPQGHVEGHPEAWAAGTGIPVAGTLLSATGLFAEAFRPGTMPWLWNRIRAGLGCPARGAAVPPPSATSATSATSASSASGSGVGSGVGSGEGGYHALGGSSATSASAAGGIGDGEDAGSGAGGGGGIGGGAPLGNYDDAEDPEKFRGARRSDPDEHAPV